MAPRGCHGSAACPSWCFPGTYRKWHPSRGSCFSFWGRAGFWEKWLLLLRPQSRVDFSVKQASPLWYPGPWESSSHLQRRTRGQHYLLLLLPGTRGRAFLAKFLSTPSQQDRNRWGQEGLSLTAMTLLHAFESQSRALSLQTQGSQGGAASAQHLSSRREQASGWTVGKSQAGGRP